MMLVVNLKKSEGQKIREICDNAYRGTHIFDEHVKYIRGRKIKMTYENPVLATIDGEKYDYIKDTIEIECDSSYFRVIC